MNKELKSVNRDVQSAIDKMKDIVSNPSGDYRQLISVDKSKVKKFYIDLITIRDRINDFS